MHVAAAEAVDRLLGIADQHQAAVAANSASKIAHWRASVSWNSSTSTSGNCARSAAASARARLRILQSPRTRRSTRSSKSRTLQACLRAWSSRARVGAQARAAACRSTASRPAAARHAPPASRPSRRTAASAACVPRRSCWCRRAAPRPCTSRTCRAIARRARCVGLHCAEPRPQPATWSALYWPLLSVLSRDRRQHRGARFVAMRRERCAQARHAASRAGRGSSGSWPAAAAAAVPARAGRAIASASPWMSPKARRRKSRLSASTLNSRHSSTASARREARVVGLRARWRAAAGRRPAHVRPAGAGRSRGWW